MCNFTALAAVISNRNLSFSIYHSYQPVGTSSAVLATQKKLASLYLNRRRKTCEGPQSRYAQGASHEKIHCVWWLLWAYHHRAFNYREQEKETLFPLYTETEGGRSRGGVVEESVSKCRVRKMHRERSGMKWGKGHVVWIRGIHQRLRISLLVLNW